VEDEVALMEAHVEGGNKWSSIAKRIPGERSHLEVKVCVSVRCVHPDFIMWTDGISNM
jgi:hypothetical protein